VEVILKHAAKQAEGGAAGEAAAGRRQWYSNKRTPQSAFDPAKGQQTYEPEKIVATCHPPQEPRRKVHHAVLCQMERLRRLVSLNVVLRVSVTR
jgi:hypothetical protein